MSDDGHLCDDPCWQSPTAAGGLNAQLQRMLSAVLPIGGVPASLHVDQDELMEGGELYSLLSGGGIAGGLGGSGEEGGGLTTGFLRTSPFAVISTPLNAGSLYELDEEVNRVTSPLAELQEC
jgi:hypothetical protein